MVPVNPNDEQIITRLRSTGQLLRRMLALSVPVCQRCDRYSGIIQSCLHSQDSSNPLQAALILLRVHRKRMSA